MKLPKVLSPVIGIAKYTFTDEIRQKSFVIMFALCALFILGIRGCYQGNYMVNGQALEAGTIIRIVSKMTFHAVVTAVMFLAALLSMRVFRHDRQDGMQSCILSKPITRPQYVAGKVLGLWTLSVAFMFTLHGIVFILASVNMKTLMPEYLLASLVCSLNLLFVVVAVLLLSLIMSDIIAFMCVAAIGIISYISDWIFAITHSKMGQAMLQQPDEQTGLTGGRIIYYLWPKIAGTQEFATSFLGGTGPYGDVSLYPLINIMAFVLVLGALLFWRFRKEDIV